MPKLKFNAWLVHWSESSLPSFEVNAHLMARVYPCWYLCSPAGMPLRRADATPALRQRVKDAAAANGVEVWPLISNYNAAVKDFDPALMRLIMGDPATSQAHIALLIDYVREDGAQGIDLDYENLYDADRDAFGDFVERLAAAFHGAGLKVGIAVHAKESEPGSPGGGRAQDYARLGRACDRVQIMGYDYHWSLGEPGPIAPPDWCGRVLAHAAGEIGSVDKVEWGVPGYGLDWGAPGTQALAVQWPRWVELVKAHGPERRDPETAELTLHYQGRELWMNDSLSLTAKLWQARHAGVAEVAMWVLGAEDPRLWALIETLPEDFLGEEA